MLSVHGLLRDGELSVLLAALVLGSTGGPESLEFAVVNADVSITLIVKVQQ